MDVVAIRQNLKFLIFKFGFNDFVQIWGKPKHFRENGTYFLKTLQI